MSCVENNLKRIVFKKKKTTVKMYLHAWIDNIINVCVVLK